MKTLLLFVFLIILNSCGDYIYDNPYDPNCEGSNCVIPEPTAKLTNKIIVNTTYPVDICYADDSLYVLEVSPTKITKIDLNNLYKEITCSLPFGSQVFGLACNQTNFWIVTGGSNNYNIYKLDKSCNVIASFPIEIYGNTGLDWYEGRLIRPYSVIGELNIYRDTTGEKVSSVSGRISAGIAYDGEYFWNAEFMQFNAGTKMRKLDASGNVISRFNLENFVDIAKNGQVTQIYGLAHDRENTLWVLIQNTSLGHVIYEFDVSGL